jgi:hypothetical protein
MKRNMRCQLSGEFLARDLDSSEWRLSQSGPNPTELRLRDADAEGAAAFRRGPIRDIAIEWRDGVAMLEFMSEGRSMTMTARSAIVHRPLPALYGALPLASYDEAARGFWRRIFRLVRLPGGRYLLGLVARRRRARS